MNGLRAKDRDAGFSADRRYRYWLSRRVSMLSDDSILWVGYNPSTADENVDDPTCRREIDYSRRWGFGWYLKANLYAWRSTDPKVIPAVADPVGPGNITNLAWMVAAANRVMCAWGSNHLTPEALALADLIRADPKSRYLRLNADGQPGHPLYLPKGLEPLAFQ